MPQRATWPSTIAIPTGIPAPTAREADMKQTTRRPAPTPVRKAEDEAPAPIPVYTAQGKLVGIIRDPEKLTRVADASTGPKLDTTPTPAGEVGIPADDVAKLRKSLRSGRTPAERDAAAELLHAAAVTKVRQIHRRAPRG